MKDIEIAQQAELWPINKVAQDAGIPLEKIEPYGHFKAKIDLPLNVKRVPKQIGRAHV